MNYLLVSVGAVAGALSRYVAVQTLRDLSTVFPWGTFIVNVIGCLAAGFIWQGCLSHPEWPRISPLLMVGFLGSFTTFSAFSLEATQMLQRPGSFFLGASYIGLSVGVCLAASFLGIWLAQLRG